MSEIICAGVYFFRKNAIVYFLPFITLCSLQKSFHSWIAISYYKLNTTTSRRRSRKKAGLVKHFIRYLTASMSTYM